MSGLSKRGGVECAGISARSADQYLRTLAGQYCRRQADLHIPDQIVIEAAARTGLLNMLIDVCFDVNVLESLLRFLN